MKIELMRLTFIASIALALGGCSSLPTITEMPPDQVAAKSRLVTDEFKKTTRLEGMTVYLDLNPKSLYKIQATKTAASGQVEISFLIDITRYTAQGWAFWEEAWDISGKKLELMQVRRDVIDGGMTREVVAVVMDQKYFESIAGKDLRIRLDGKNAKREIVLYGTLTAGFLKSLPMLN